MVDVQEMVIHQSCYTNHEEKLFSVRSFISSFMVEVLHMYV